VIAGFEREGAEQDVEPTEAANRCRRCSSEGPRSGFILHPDPSGSDGRRVLCGDCQGRANAVRNGMVPR
jgi:Zn finger protein HypA/HybF involved in hydrogenase expression